MGVFIVCYSLENKEGRIVVFSMKNLSRATPMELCVRERLVTRRRVLHGEQYQRKEQVSGTRR